MSRSFSSPVARAMQSAVRRGSSRAAWLSRPGFVGRKGALPSRGAQRSGPVPRD
jgi:hypothetical protein